MQVVFVFFLTVLFFSISEVALLLWVSARTGLLFTILAGAVTGLVGGSLVHRQGILTWQNINRELSQGRLPADELIGGLLLLIVGVLLCVPGFITDTLGFLIVIPGIRHLVAAALRRQLTARLAGSVTLFNAQGGHFHTGGQPASADSHPAGFSSPTQNAQPIEDVHPIKDRPQAEDPPSFKDMPSIDDAQIVSDDGSGPSAGAGPTA